MFVNTKQRYRDAVGWLLYKLVRILLLLAMKVVRVKLDVVGAKLLPRHEPYILVIAPHTSFMDGPLMVAVSRRRWIGIGMAELLSWKDWTIISILFRYLGHIPVQRDNPDSRKEALELGKEVLRRGIPLLVSPPGRIRDPNVRDIWRDGYAKIAYATGTKVALVRIYGAKAFMDEGPDEEWIFDFSAPMKVVVGAVVDPSDYTSADALHLDAQRIFDSLAPAA